MNAVELAYMDEGDPEAPVLVLLHGEAKDADPWRELRPMLSTWMRVIAPSGGADGPAEVVAERVRGLLERLGVRRFAVAAEGASGPAAQLLALEGRVEALVLVGSPALEGGEGGLAGLEIPALVVYGEDDPTLPAAELAERFAEVLAMGSVALLPGRGHALLEEAPETVGPLVFQWLRSRFLRAPHAHEAGPVVVELGRRPPGERT